MENWKIFILCVLFILVYRLLYNLTNLFSIRKFYSDYLKYLNNPQFSFSEKTPQIVKLFKNAEITDFTITKLEPTGFGTVERKIITGFSNIQVTDHEIIILTKQKFHEAIGVFKARIKETINPLFWIEFILKLPSYIFKYVGLKSESILSKILQIIYWIIGITIGLEKLGLINLSELISK